MYSTGVLINAIFVAIDCLQREVYSVGRENEVVNAKALFVYAEFLLFMIKTIFVCNFLCAVHVHLVSLRIVSLHVCFICTAVWLLLKLK